MSIIIYDREFVSWEGEKIPNLDAHTQLNHLSMKEKLTQLIKKLTPEIIACLQKLLDSTKTRSYKPIALETLTPTRDADEDDIYKSALKNAIDNPNNYNIGVAGAYGSGKSSILESFKKKHENEYRFLSISLASFNENNLTESEIRKENKN